MLTLDPHSLRRHSIDLLAAHHQHMCPPTQPGNSKRVVVNGKQYADAMAAQIDTGIPARVISMTCNGVRPPRYRTMDPRTHKPLIVGFVARYV